MRLTRSWIAPAIVLAALALSSLAAGSAITVIPAANVAASADTVTYVLPGGATWEMGVRPGQEVLESRPGELPEEWRIRTRTATGTTVATKAAMISALRGTQGSAVVALALSLIGLVVLIIRPGTAAALGVSALALARPAMLATGDMAGSSLAAVAALGAAAIWLLAWSGRPRLAGVAGMAALIAGSAWLVLRYQAAEAPDLADAYGLTALAVTVLTYLFAGLVVLSVVVTALRSRAGGYDLRRLGDVAVVATAAVTVPLAISLNVSIWTIVLAVGMLLVIYPFTRGRLGAALDQLVLGDVRARSSVEAIERERQRVSREIHDQPLQELAAVIHRLAGRPELAAETAMLQEVSGQLRGVTMQLHPPILSDLGLGPSLEFLVSEVDRDAAASVTATVQSSHGARPPAEVELAAFRIAQESLTNAIRHSAARTITLRATIQASAVTIEVVDDGVGLDGVAAGQALSRGHIGLRSMDERAQLVGGDLRVEGDGPGTRIRFRWPA